MTQSPQNAFILSNDPEMHRVRRKQILASHPEVKTLFGYEYKTKYIAFVLVMGQFLLAYYGQRWGWMAWLLSLYCLGATISHSLFTVIHELTHHLGFRSRWANRLFAIFCNLPLGIPMAMGFEKYHFAHHLHMGDAKKDTDIPFSFEARWFNSTLGKLGWLLIQPFMYAFRPFVKWPQPISAWEWFNLVTQLLFDVWVVVWFGPFFLIYLIAASLISMSIHPTAAHTLSEHIVVSSPQETYSYYGPMNYVLFQVGYHVEHHDFPTIPWSRIRQLKRMAPAYYEDLYAHPSWLVFMLKFIFSREIQLFSRVVRV